MKPFRLKPFRWTAFRKAIRALLELGDTPDEIKERMRQMRIDAAKDGKWRDAELACAMASDDREVDEVSRRLKGD